MRKIEIGVAKPRFVVTFAPFVLRVEIVEQGQVLLSFEFEDELPRMGWIELGGTKQS